MNILKHALFGGGGDNAQISLVGGIPGGGEVGGLEFSLDDTDFQFKAGHNMEIVGGLIGQQSAARNQLRLQTFPGSRRR